MVKKHGKGIFLVIESDDFAFIARYAKKNGFKYANKTLKNGLAKP